ncbi:MAG: ribonuclease R [Streptococcaceae bacterium]|jgi:ribonuclease R|nr:ribonuclease R [Streptococcaceae bacterium]
MREKIVDFLKKNHKPLAPDVLARRLEMSAPEDYKAMYSELLKLENEKKIQFLKSGEVRLRKEGPRVEGVFRANSRGFGFVTIDDSDEPDAFIPNGKTRWALDGDRVQIEITRNGNPLSGTSAEGIVKHILERGTKTLVGTFTETMDDGYIGTIASRNRKLTAPILVQAEGLHPKTGDLVKLDVTGYPQNKEGFITGLVTKIIGSEGDTGIDVLEILESMDIRSEFSAEVMTQVDNITEEITEAELAGREDFRNEVIYTIDGADSKDLDDAIHVKDLGSGLYELGVHIADVSHYVTEGSALDEEALERATSVYVTDRVVPMLPVKLSNGICSLNPQVDRLTQSCVMKIDGQGQILDYRIVQSVIKTTYRMTYDDVNLMIAGDAEALEKFPKIADSVKTAVKLHEILEAMRLRRGALEFETTESKIVVDSAGVPQKIVKRTRGIAEKMIESFMLAANETVAFNFMKRELPAIYRIHEEPKVEKIRLFVDFAAAAGLPFQGDAAKVKNADLQSFMRRVKGTPYEAVLDMMLLRSMQQARYSENNVGHFGLAAENYTHFTSPIRRYPDLLVHRLIDNYISGHVAEDVKTHFHEVIPGIAQQSSSRERRAIDAEREVTKIKSAEYMAQFVGETFDGVISGVTGFGAFVQLENTVEGLIATRELKERFNFNDRNLTLQNESTGLIFKIGAPVRVKLTGADKATGQIDFQWVKSDLDVYEKVVKSERPERRGNRGSSSLRAENRASKDAKASRKHGPEEHHGHKPGDYKKNDQRPFYKKGKKSFGKAGGKSQGKKR